MGKVQLNKLSLFFWLFIVWIICSFFLCSQKDFGGKTFLLLLASLCYLIGFSSIRKLENRNKEFHGPAYYLFFIVCLVKYFVMPLSLCVSKKFLTIGPPTTDSSYYTAILITVYELFCLILLRVLFLNNHISKKKIYFRSGEIKSNGNRIILMFFGVTLIGIILSLIPGFKIIPENLFILDENFEGNSQVENYSVVVVWWKYVFFISTFSLLYYLFKKHSNKLFYYLSVFFILLFLGLITGTSRWGILFFLLIALFLSYKMYGSRVKKVILPISLVSFATIISITLYKFSWAFKEVDNLYIGSLQIMMGQLQSYFSGPNLIAQALEMNSNPLFMDKITYSTFVNDFLGSLPSVAKHIDQTDRINYYFNRYLFDWYSDKTSQIIPMVAVGAIYFNIFFSPIFTIFFTWIGFMLERKALVDNRIYCKFLYLYAAFWCVLAICFCPQIIWGNLVGFVIPIYIIYKFLVIKISK